MNKYTVTHPITIQSGLLQLTPAQAKGRLHNLTEVASGLFEVVKPVCFKAGESIGYEGDLPKNLVEFVIAEKKKVEKPKAD